MVYSAALFKQPTLFFTHSAFHKAASYCVTLPRNFAFQEILDNFAWLWLDWSQLNERKHLLFMLFHVGLLVRGFFLSHWFVVVLLSFHLKNLLA
jgi:hypothetical protein